MGWVSVLEFALSDNYLRAAIILVMFIIIGKITLFILRNIRNDIFSKRKHRIVHKVIDLSIFPLTAFIGLLGTYLALVTAYTNMDVLSIFENLFFVAMVLLFSYYFGRLSTFFVQEWFQKRDGSSKVPGIVNKVIVIMLITLSIAVILGYFRVNVTPILATLGIGTVALGLALQSTLGSFFAGLRIVSEKPLDTGEYIEFQNGELQGFVEDVGWGFTKVRTLQNNLVVVPNSYIVDNSFVNDNLPNPEASIWIPCGVDYRSDLDTVEKITIDVAKKIQEDVPGAVSSFEPFIRFREFGASNINFVIVLRVEKLVDKYLVRHEFIKALKKRYDQEGIEISWPVSKSIRFDGDKMKSKP